MLLIDGYDSILHMPNSLWMYENLSSDNGLVKISTNWCSVLMNLSSISWFSTWSLMKWCLTSICLVLEWWTGFLLRLIALVLSQWMGMLSNEDP